MGDSCTNSATPLDPGSTLEATEGSIHALSHLPSLPPKLGQEPQDSRCGWETIGGQRDFYDERDCLDPSYNLVREKLKDRGRDDVVIFRYPLDPDNLSRVEGDPPVGGGCPSSVPFCADNDIFFRVPKNELLESKQFNQTIKPEKESQPIQTRRLRLGIV